VRLSLSGKYCRFSSISVVGYESPSILAAMMKSLSVRPSI
jgi:hypothetical protein